jgi:hypothetical protein
VGGSWFRFAMVSTDECFFWLVCGFQSVVYDGDNQGLVSAIIGQLLLEPSRIGLSCQYMCGTLRTANLQDEKASGPSYNCTRLLTVRFTPVASESFCSSERERLGEIGTRTIWLDVQMAI